MVKNFPEMSLESLTETQKETMQLMEDVRNLIERDYESITIGTVNEICKRLDNTEDPFVADLWNDPFNGNCTSLGTVGLMRHIVTENAKDEALLDKELADFANEIHARKSLFRRKAEERIRDLVRPGYQKDTLF